MTCVVPVVEIPDLARIANLAASPRFTGVAGAATGAGLAKVFASTETAEGLDSVMGKAPPRKLVRAPTADSSMMVFTVVDP